MKKHTSSLDIQSIRQDFPIISRKVYGKPLIYLDNAATSQKPRQVIETLIDYYENYNSNIHRGVHALSIEATERYEEARAKIAKFIGAKNSSSIIFVRNTTEAINLIAHAWGSINVRKGDEILTTEMEHHSNLVPWQTLSRAKEATLNFVPVTPEGTLNLDNIEQLLNERTRLFAFTQMSNLLGTINPINNLVEMAHNVGALTVIDGAQGVPHTPVNVSEIDCDFMAFSGHKMLGPTGIGVLYVKNEIIESLEPFLTGGEMVREVWFDHASWNDLPYKFEAGTPNIADAVAMGAAIDYLEQLGMDRVRQHEVELTTYALAEFIKLEKEAGLIVFGPTDINIRGGIISFHAPGVHPHDMGTLLDRQGIAVRTGHHCAMPLTRERLKVSATTRASFYIYNTIEEIDELIAGIRAALRFFKGSAHNGI